MATSQIAIPSATRSARMTLTDPLGLHLRLAAHLARIAGGFGECDLRVATENRAANAKSPLEMMLLAAEKGSELIVEATGERAEEAIGAMLCSFGAGGDGWMSQWDAEGPRA